MSSLVLALSLALMVVVGNTVTDVVETVSVKSSNMTMIKQILFISS